MIHIKQSHDCDVLIVGAGPAGAVAASYIANAGFTVWLLDKDQFPRDKVCGDFIGPVGLVELMRIGVSRDVLYQQSNKIDYASAYLNGRELVSAAIPAIPNLPPFGRVIPRKQLDQWIVDAARKAGSKMLQGYRINAIRHEKDSVVVAAVRDKKKSRIRARLLIGADGSNSVVARTLRGYAPPDHDRIVAVRAYYGGVSGPDNRCDLYFSSDSFPGYCWLFPTGEATANVGVGVASKTLPQGKRALKSLLQQLVDKDSALGQRLHDARVLGKVAGWPLTTYDHRQPIVWDRVMLSGDAAGLINPLNGEGIQYALLSGRWSAYYAIQGLTHDSLSAKQLTAYTQTVERELRYDMAISNLIVQLIRNRHLAPVWLRTLEIIGTAAREQPGYAEIAGGVLAGLIPANNLLGYQIIGGTIKQAALSVGGEVFYRSIRNPADSMRLGIDAGKAGAAMVVNSLRNPVETVKWGIGVTANAAELANQYYRDVTGRQIFGGHSLTGDY
jgi:geranylgeranyl reductase family protein